MNGKLFEAQRFIHEPIEKPVFPRNINGLLIECQHARKDLLSFKLLAGWNPCRHDSDVPELSRLDFIFKQMSVGRSQAIDDVAGSIDGQRRDALSTDGHAEVRYTDGFMHPDRPLILAARGVFQQVAARGCADKNRTISGDDVRISHGQCVRKIA